MLLFNKLKCLKADLGKDNSFSKKNCRLPKLLLTLVVNEQSQFYSTSNLVYETKTAVVRNDFYDQFLKIGIRYLNG